MKYMELGGKGFKEVSHGIRLRTEAHSYYKNIINYLWNAHYIPDPGYSLE